MEALKNVEDEHDLASILDASEHAQVTLFNST
jgi:hypothetical protein